MCVCARARVATVQTLMEKFGDMLEAAAETAVPAAPANAAVGDGHRLADGRGEWMDWDAATLVEFMNQEVNVQIVHYLMQFRCT